MGIASPHDKYFKAMMSDSRVAKDAMTKNMNLFNRTSRRPDQGMDGIQCQGW